MDRSAQFRLCIWGGVSCRSMQTGKAHLIAGLEGINPNSPLHLRDQQDQTYQFPYTRVHIFAIIHVLQKDTPPGVFQTTPQDRLHK